MNLLLQLLVVTSLFAVLYSAPLENNAESTTVGISPLPAQISKRSDDSSPESSESDESDEKKRIYRETPPQTHTDSKSTQSTSTKPEVVSRPVRDVPHFIAGVPTPTSTQSTPTNQQNTDTNSRNERAVEDPKPPSPPSSAGNVAHPPPPALLGNAAHPPPPAANHPQEPSPAKRLERDTNQPQTKPVPAKQTRPAPIPAKIDKKPASRPARDTNHPVPQTRPAPTQQRPVTLPARINNKPEAKPPQRQQRDLSSPGATASSTTTEKNEGTSKKTSD